MTVPGMGKKNTFYTFTFDGQVADVETIARGGLHKHATAMLNSPVNMLGLKGMRKLARELTQWPDELTPEHLDISLHHLVEFTGMPPILPNRLTGYEAPDHHTAGHDGFANLLPMLASDYAIPAWAEAAALFEQSGQALVTLTDVIVDFLLGRKDTLAPASALITEIVDLETSAFRTLN
ncbi:MAG: DUF4872 domain-containing protein [Anaerolineae bacterium]|nr:DUF4872 domain-containing protein [Anaerolineae bacterium]